MKQETSSPLYAFMQKKYAIVLALGLVIFIFAIAYYVCTIDYEKQKSEVLEEQKTILSTWVSGTVQSISVWTRIVDEQAQRVSGSELYRLFVQDLNDAGGEIAAIINDVDVTSRSYSAEVEPFAEQLPIMRNVLYDYMNYNGLTDARLVSSEGATLLSSLARPAPLSDEQKIISIEAVTNNRIIFAPIRSSSSGLVIDYAVPILPVVELENSKPIAALLLTQPITSQIAQFLARDMRQDGMLTPYIIQKNGSEYQNIQIHSPQPATINSVLNFNAENNSLPFQERMSISNSGLVYSSGAKVPEMDMWVVLEVSGALMASRLQSIAWTVYGLGFLASAGVILLFALLWWVLIGKEQKAVADKFKNLYSLIAQQKSLLDSINISLQVGLILVDTSGRIQVFNKSFASIVNHNPDEMKDASLMTVFSGSTAGIVVDKVQKVIETNEPLTFEVELALENSNPLYRVTMYPFVDDTKPNTVSGAVATFQDITEFRRNSEKNKQQQASIIKAFVRAIEGIDPYLTGHSQTMSAIGQLMCDELDLSEEDKNIVHNASIFSQLGKLFIAREILSKTGKLTDEELAELKQIPEKGYEVLSSIGFSKSISLAVRQMYEQIDGNGYPQKLKGNDIVIHARILAITNAFCAMISNRSFRSGLPLADAMARLKKDVHVFDPTLVEVLEKVINTPEGAVILAAPKQ